MIKELEEILNIIWGEKPKKSRKRKRDRRGRYTK